MFHHEYPYILKILFPEIGYLCAKLLDAPKKTRKPKLLLDNGVIPELGTRRRSWLLQKSIHMLHRFNFVASVKWFIASLNHVKASINCFIESILNWS
jgi:hypothetical protein